GVKRKSRPGNRALSHRQKEFSAHSHSGRLDRLQRQRRQADGSGDPAGVCTQCGRCVAIHAEGFVQFLERSAYVLRSASWTHASESRSDFWRQAESAETRPRLYKSVFGCGATSWEEDRRTSCGAGFRISRSSVCAGAIHRSVSERLERKTSLVDRTEPGAPFSKA